MRKMRIDFAPRGWRRTLYRVHPAALAGCALGLALCVGAALSAYGMLEQRRAHELRLRQLNRQQASQQAQAPAAAKVAIPESQARAVNAAVLQLNLPWRELQEAVGEGTPANIALLALEPDPRKQVLKISAEAKNADDMIAYIEQLKEQEFFSGAALVRHEIYEADANRPLRFQVEAQWVAR
ncbi:hypothetical protein [Pseudoduganella namucuonensis]|uniref:Fimbrial assembly protein n=1 Tax=Pseudoduganella namucuonensis TaxID=1035707 RepID=A0A1I7LY35_9BURK|nr:hypothetical protein [Pseudoduganella namucuonensis]SFV14631.1 hypothetical protein SAMN05216552_104314 [Pseudoduganella namucuonensis]